MKSSPVLDWPGYFSPLAWLMNGGRLFMSNWLVGGHSLSLYAFFSFFLQELRILSIIEQN